MRTYAVHPQKGGASSYDGSDWKDCAITHMIFLILLCQVSGLFFPTNFAEILLAMPYPIGLHV